jgi:hypothetical protein
MSVSEFSGNIHNAQKTFVLLGNGFVLQRVFSSFPIDFSGDM